MWKVTSLSEKRPTCVKRGLLFNIRPTCVKRDLHMWKDVKRDILIWKETYTCEKKPMWVEKDLHMSKQTGTLVKRYICKIRSTYVKRDILMWKKIYTCGKSPTHKRDLYCIIKSIHVTESWKRDATHVCEKRPTYV